MTKEKVIEQLKNVKDPEIGLDIWTLGLVYDITLKDGGCDILMTLTTPFCPFADQLIQDTKLKVGQLYKDPDTVRVALTFEPPWEPTDELRAMLGL